MPPMQQQPQQGKGGMPASVQQNLAGRTQPGKGGLPQGGYVGGPNGPSMPQQSIYGGMRPGGGQMGSQQPGKGGMPGR